MTKGQRIKKIRESRDMSQTDLAIKIDVSKQTLYKYENDIITNIPSDKIEALADALKVSPAEIMGWSDKHESKGVLIPVLGRVAAGYPIEAVENIIDMEEISADMVGDFVGLQIHGDSMEPRMRDGDVVIVRRQADADSGDTVIAMINGDEAACKKLIKHQDGITLVSTNTKYDPMYYSNREIQEKPITIFGKVVELRAKF